MSTLKVSSHVLMFKPQFADDVEAGRKNRTMRPPRKRKIKVGDRLDLRKWSGKPYASKQVKLREATCTAVHEVFIATARCIRIDNVLVIPEILDAFAKLDGFETSEQMIAFFDKEHGLPFCGDLIEFTGEITCTSTN